MTVLPELLSRAKASFEQGRLVEARQQYLDLLAQMPDDPEVLNDLGTVCFAMGQIGESCGYYLKALQLDQQYEQARKNLEIACRTYGASPEEMARRLMTQANPAGGVTCPCCGRQFREFSPVGVRKRRNALCPVCGSRERHRAIWLYLKRRTDLLSARLRVLHFAPAPALQQILGSLPNLDYITADLCSPRAMLKMDITDIYLKDNCVDVILCVHVLEHVTDDRKAMLELLRVLRPGGWAILQTPFDPKRESTFEDPGITRPEDRERVYGQKDHVRIYGRDYLDRLAEAGFAVKMDSYLRQLDPGLIDRYSLGKELDICLCTKPAPAA